MRNVPPTRTAPRPALQGFFVPVTGEPVRSKRGRDILLKNNTEIGVNNTLFISLRER